MNYQYPYNSEGEISSSMEKDKETVTVEEEGFSLELPAPSGWKKKGWIATKFSLIELVGVAIKCNTVGGIEDFDVS
ncbi:hypothetical protein NC651_039078 [Populus alba x Populus x berolinensis]|nr:hypothetical protein NC651_039078 [Populus alba x Populus x berolinensis]